MARAIRHFLTSILIPCSVAAIGAQGASPRFNAHDARSHVGETVTVCGRIVDTSCKDTPAGGDVLLVFRSTDDPMPFRIRIPAAAVERFGSRIGERLEDAVMCSTGRVEEQDKGFEILVTDPTQIVL